MQTAPSLAARRGRRSPQPPLLAIVLALAAACLAVPGCDTADDSDADRGAGHAAIVPGEEWTDPGGRWHMMTDTGTLTEEQREEFDRLKSIGYLSGSTEAPEERGITVHDPTRAYAGLNFFTSGHVPGAFLMDMDGNILHEWRHSFIDAWATGPREELPRSTKGAGFWRRAHLFENGDVLAVFDGMGLIKVDRNSELIWAYLAGAHHDLEVADDGSIYTLIREPAIVPRVDPDHAVLVDFVAVLDPGGNELRRIPLLEAFEQSDHADLLEGMKDKGDIFHTNTIEILDGSLADRVPGFDRGNLLICPRELDVIAVVDVETEKVVWGLKAPWVRPHQPTVLPNGNILIFDNRGYFGASRLLEFDPVTFDIAWGYQTTNPMDFYSKECGSNIRLPNGNTLVTETDRGRAFEVTRGSEIVWEYVNPAHAGDSNEFIASLFEMIRLEPDFPVGWIEEE
jgi:hypothetical protein